MNAATACPACGNALDPSRATYDKNGVLVCANCAAKNQIAEGDSRASNSLAGTAIGVLLGGLLSWTCLGMFAILPLVITVTGIGWLFSIARNPSLRARLGGKLVWCVIAAVIGLGAAALALLVNGIALLGLTGSHRY